MVGDLRLWHENEWSQLCFAGSGHVTRGSGLKVSDRGGGELGGGAFMTAEWPFLCRVQMHHSTTRGQNRLVGSGFRKKLSHVFILM